MLCQPDTVNPESVMNGILDYLGKDMFELIKSSVSTFQNNKNDFELHSGSKDVLRIIAKDKNTNPDLTIPGRVLQCEMYPDGKRMSINSWTDDATKNVLEFMDESDLVFSFSKSDVPPSSFRVYPNANKELLSVQAKPGEGNIRVIQGEYAITSSTDPNPVLSTFAISTCVGLLLYDPKAKVGAIAHVDYHHTIPETFDEMVNGLRKIGGKQFISGYTNNIEPLWKNGIVKKYAREIVDELELPREFSFDTRTGDISQYRMTNDPTFEKRAMEKTPHRGEELIDKTFCIYKPIQLQT